jgi:hypothetical protein
MESRRRHWPTTQGRPSGADARGATPPPTANARRETTPPATDARRVTPPPAAGTGAQGAVGDIGASTSSLVINVDPINVMPGGTDEDLVRDRAQLEQAPKDLGSSSV